MNFQIYIILGGLALLLIFLYLIMMSLNKEESNQITKPSEMKNWLVKQNNKLDRFKYMKIAGLKDIAIKNAVFYDLVNIHKDITRLQVCTIKLLPNNISDLVIGTEISPDTVYLGGILGLQKKSIRNWLEKSTDSEKQTLFEQYYRILIKEIEIINKEIDKIYERL